MCQTIRQINCLLYFLYYESQSNEIYSAALSQTTQIIKNNLCS